MQVTRPAAVLGGRINASKLRLLTGNRNAGKAFTLDMYISHTFGYSVCRVSIYVMHCIALLFSLIPFSFRREKQQVGYKMQQTIYTKPAKREDD